MEKNSSLVWSPIYNSIQTMICQQKRITLLISPFIKLDALKALITQCEDISELKIIARWASGDIISKVTDLEIYPYLKNKKIPLYIHPSIHLKLYIFRDGIAFHTSGNITRKGLGLIEKHNIEVGCKVVLGFADWQQVYQLLQESVRVDDTIYERAKQYLNDNAKDINPVAPLDLYSLYDNKFSILSLPATANPFTLYGHYMQEDAIPMDEVASYIHDIILYQVPTGLEQSIFFKELKKRFTSNAFIQAIADLIRREKNARFGLVNQWIQDTCSDKPTPYRWELKKNTRSLYNWLAYFYPEITWNRPKHSMIISWNDINIPNDPADRA